MHISHALTRSSVARTLALFAVVALATSGCTADYATQNNSSLHMEVAGIAPLGGEIGGQLQSDVASDTGTAFNDDVAVTVTIYRKNPGVTSTSPLEHVFLDRYEVRFFRSDGHNAVGIDVPHSISGPLGNARLHTPTGTGEIDLTVPLTLVRQAAKLEPPLRNLRGGGGLTILTCFAEITVYARQLDGGTLRAQGTIQVTFADFPG